MCFALPPTCFSASTPNNVAAAFGPSGFHLMKLVPPTWFCTTATAYSASEVPGLLHPGTGKGSPRFQPVPPLNALLSEENWLLSGRSQLSSLRLSHPPKKSAKQEPFRISAAVASSPLRLCIAAVALDLEALLPHLVRSDPPLLPAACHPLLPWALVPSRVLDEWGIHPRCVSAPSMASLAAGPSHRIAARHEIGRAHV